MDYSKLMKLDHSKLMKQNNDMWKDYEAVESNVLKEITGSTLDEKIQKANWEVNKSVQDFLNSDEYKTVAQNMYAEFGPNDEATLPFEEDDFYLYVKEKDMDYLENASTDEYDKDVIVKLETGEDMFVTESMIKPCKELKGAYRIAVGYDQKVPAVNPGTRETKQITGTDLFNEMAEKRGKDVQRAAKVREVPLTFEEMEQADELLRNKQNDLYSSKKEDSPAD